MDNLQAVQQYLQSNQFDNIIPLIKQEGNNFDIPIIDRDGQRYGDVHWYVTKDKHDFNRKLQENWNDEITTYYMKAMSQCLHFGKSVHDNGWGVFVMFLKYKLEEQGKRLVKVSKYFASSQICSCCGYKNPITKDLFVREWACPQCGTHHDRDINAAINIRNEGMRIAFAQLTHKTVGHTGIAR